MVGEDGAERLARLAADLDSLTERIEGDHDLLVPTHVTVTR